MRSWSLLAFIKSDKFGINFSLQTEKYLIKLNFTYVLVFFSSSTVINFETLARILWQTYGTVTIITGFND